MTLLEMFIIFGVGNNSSSHADNCKNNFLALVEGPTFGINRRFGSPEKKFSIKLVNTKFCLNLHYNADNSYLFVNGKEIFKFKTDSKNGNFPTQFCLRSISNGFSAIESREVLLNGNVYDFSGDYKSIDKSDILNIHKYLMTKNNIMYSLIKQVFIILLNFSKSLITKCVSLKDEPCTVRPTLTDLNPVELKYYPFMIILDKFSGSCNVLSPKICVLENKNKKNQQKTNVKAFNMITNKNEAKTMAKHISCDFKCKFDSTTCNSNQKWNMQMIIYSILMKILVVQYFLVMKWTFLI